MHNWGYISTDPNPDNLDLLFSAARKTFARKSFSIGLSKVTVKIEAEYEQDVSNPGQPE